MGETNLGGGAPAAPLIHVVDPGAGGSVREAEAEGRQRTEKAEKYLEAKRDQLALADQITSTVLNRIRETLRTQYKLQASEVEQLLLQRFPEAAPLLRSTEPTHQPPTNPSQRTAATPATEAPVNAGAETGRTDSQPGTTAGGDNQAFAQQQREGLHNVASGKTHLLAANPEGRPTGPPIPVPPAPARPPGPATPQPQVVVRQQPPQPPQPLTGPDGKPLVAHPSRGTLTPKVPATPSALASADPSALPVNPTPEGLPPTPGSPVLPRGEVKQFALGPKIQYSTGAATSEQEVENLTLAARLGVLQNGGPTVAQASPPSPTATGLLAARKETVAERGKGDAGKTEGKGDKGGLDGAFALGLRRQAQYIPA